MRKAYKSSESKLLRDEEEDKITTYLAEREWEGAIWIFVARDKFSRWFSVITYNANSHAIREAVC
jgi:hypothetical protein